MMRKKCVLGAALCALAILVSAPASAVSIGDKAPEISATDWLNTDKLSLATLRGRIVVVEFWATWCPPCRASIPHLNQIHSNYDAKGVVLISLTNEDRAKVEPFAKQMKMNYRLGLGSRSSGAYGVTGIPHAFVISPTGNLLWKGHPMAGLDKAVEDALKNHPPKLLSSADRAKATASAKKAESALRRGDFAGAVKEFSAAQAIDSGNSLGATIGSVRAKIQKEARKRLQRARRLVKSGSVTAATKIYREIDGAFAADSAEAKEISDSLDSLKNDPRLMAEQAKAQLAKMAQEIYKKGADAERRKSYATALRYYDKVRVKFPNSEAGKKATDRAAALRSNKALMSAASSGAQKKKVARLMARARSWESNGRSDLALADYKKVLALTPDGEQAAVAKARIKALTTPKEEARSIPGL